MAFLEKTKFSKVKFGNDWEPNKSVAPKNLKRGKLFLKFLIFKRIIGTKLRQLYPCLLLFQVNFAFYSKRLEMALTAVNLFCLNELN